MPSYAQNNIDKPNIEETDQILNIKPELKLIKNTEKEELQFWLGKNRKKYEEIMMYNSADLPNVKNDIWERVWDLFKNMNKTKEKKTLTTEEIIKMRAEVEFKIHQEKEKLINNINRQTNNLSILSEDQINTLFTQANDILSNFANELTYRYEKISISLVDALEQFLYNAQMELKFYKKEVLNKKFNKHKHNNKKIALK